MINRLKRKFILIATVSMFVLMAGLVTVMNAVNYRQVTAESDAVLDVLSQPGLPFLDEAFLNGKPQRDRDGGRDFIPRGMSPEVPYESRFFAATVSAEGEVLQADLSRIVSVDEASAETYIAGAMNSKNERGFIGQFRYVKTAEDDGTRILFLDCGRRLDAFRSFLWISVIVALVGCVLVFIAFVLAAGRIVAPIAESYEKQKRFISDAGHEIKTPLTIINANVDLLELDGEKEELAEIRSQTGRLTTLTNDLVMLSKMEEAAHTLQKVEIPLSDLVAETAASFRAPAAARRQTLKLNVEPGVTVKASPDAVRQLVSILMDNAVKYTPADGEITVEMRQHRRQAEISVRNPTAEPVDEKALTRVFDRFYRTDASRNSETGGHGIGLSVAKAVTEAHGGEISAATTDGHDFCVTATLPTETK